MSEKNTGFVAQVQIYIPAGDIIEAREKAFKMLESVPYMFFQVLPAGAAEKK